MRYAVIKVGVNIYFDKRPGDKQLLYYIVYYGLDLFRIFWISVTLEYIWHACRRRWRRRRAVEGDKSDDGVDRDGLVREGEKTNESDAAEEKNMIGKVDIVDQESSGHEKDDVAKENSHVVEKHDTVGKSDEAKKND